VEGAGSFSVTEKSIQTYLFRHCRRKRVRLMSPNASLSVSQDGLSAFWEADFILVERTGFATEFEIKLSRSDFLLDVKTKTAKHAVLNSPIAGCPNRFYYVCPAYLIKPAEVPVYAGLIYVENNALTKIKKAPRLHSLEFPDTMIKQMHISLMYRFWTLRNRGL
jgi:hypothetical protein